MLFLQRNMDENKNWPLEESLSINRLEQKERFDRLASLCQLPQPPDTCQGAVDSIDLTCPFVQLMLRTKHDNRTGQRFNLLGKFTFFKNV